MERSASGNTGGVIGLVFLSGFVLAEGASVADGQGGSLPPWVSEDNVSLTHSSNITSFLNQDVIYSLRPA